MNEEKYYTIIPTEKYISNFNYLHPYRKNVNQQLANLLDIKSKEIKMAFSLYNSAIIGLDRLIDRNVFCPEYILYCINLIKNSWDKKEIPYSNQYEQNLIKLVLLLTELDGTNSDMKYVYKNILDDFSQQYINASRRWKILSGDEIRRYRINCGKHYAAGLLKIMIPQLEIDFLEKYAALWSLSVKIVDDMIDIHDDIPLGIINIPLEDINMVSGLEIEGNQVKSFKLDELRLNKEYAVNQISQAKSIYLDSKQLLEENIHNFSDLDRQLALLFSEFAYSWFIEAKQKLELTVI